MLLTSVFSVYLNTFLPNTQSFGIDVIFCQKKKRTQFGQFLTFPCSFSYLLNVFLPAACPVDVRIKMPYIENLGSSLALVMILKNATHVFSEFGNMSTLWDGSDGLSVPYYSQQKLSTFFIEVDLI